jgi:hypothetical protein
MYLNFREKYNLNNNVNEDNCSVQLMKKVISSVESYEDQCELYDYILKSYDNKVYKSRRFYIGGNKVLKEFAKCDYYHHIITNHDELPLNIFLHYLGAKPNKSSDAQENSDAYDNYDTYISELEELLILFKKDFIFTDVDYIRGKKSVIYCIVEILHYLIKRKVPNVYEKHKELLMNIVHINIDDYMNQK